MRRTLVIMVKEPRPGRVKTRLGRDIGMTSAAWWFRHQTARLIRGVGDPRWRIVLAVSPDRAGLQSRVWPAGCQRQPQGRGDLGNRMARLLRAQPPGPVCVIGADVPGITRRHVAQAFGVLARADMVLGPAPDGGYWLVGLRHPSRAPGGLFAGVRWSSCHAMSDTVASVPSLRVAYAETLQDVDTLDDLRMTTGCTRATSTV
ncbi:MAG: TIGR04282 family arsenosugar biosynthesis glycosyltransferase [Roseobacter sp.]|jgi:rSAM/selenodomain-associated transferase 1|nr:TIGR04282 family arsenosugar biosynthesis glycosyltransferase [Roseobacter sp.]